MANTIEDLKRVLKGGSRTTKFAVRFSIPTAVDKLMETSDVNTLVKATSFPQMTVGQMESWIQGRKLPLPGDTEYQTTWEVTFYMDNAHKIRKQMVAWMKAIDNFQANTHSGVPADLFAEMSVAQLDSLGKTVALYTFKDVWPNMINQTDVDASQVNTLEECMVTFSFSSWIVEGSDGSTYNTPNDGRAASTNSTSVDQ
jgi:ketosteroid isomerase-like protein